MSKVISEIETRITGISFGENGLFLHTAESILVSSEETVSYVFPVNKNRPLRFDIDSWRDRRIVIRVEIED